MAPNTGRISRFVNQQARLQRYRLYPSTFGQNFMKKVLHLRCSGQLLGAERVILELSKELPQLGYESIIGVPVEASEGEPELVSVARAQGYQVVTFPISGAFDFSVLGRIKKYVSEQKISVVHAHGYREDLYALKCRGLAPLVATNHLWKRTDFKLKLYAKLDAFLLRFFEHLIAVSKPVAEDMQKAGLKKCNISIVANGIDTSVYGSRSSGVAIRQQLQLRADAVVLGTLSSLTSEKGIDIALRAFALVQKNIENLSLLIIGDGPERKNLLKLAQESGISNRVIFAGRRADIPQVLSAIDLFLLPSHAEGLPMALLEAMASGCAVVATRVGDVPEVVNAECGTLVEPGNPESFAQAIIEQLSDRILLQRRGESARKIVEQHFSSRAMAEHYAAIYNRFTV